MPETDLKPEITVIFDPVTVDERALFVPYTTEWQEVLPSPAESVAAFTQAVYELEKPTLWGRALLPRIIEKIAIDLNSGCWVVVGARINQQGYAEFWDEERRRSAKAHRYVYQRLVGPIPSLHELDHRCRERACCWPAHLEPKTRLDHAKAGAQDRWHIRRPGWQTLFGDKQV